MIPKTVFGSAYVKEDRDSLPFSVDNLDDRIINLLFIRTVKGENGKPRTFPIRSDYEPIFRNNSIVGFKPCVEKPDIKVTYNQVAESVAIEVKIEVTNFYIGDAEKDDSMFSHKGDPISYCLVQMGYRAQFPDLSKMEQNDAVMRYYELDNNVIDRKRSALVNGHKQILVQILTAYGESYPPDQKTVFNGIIGTMESGLRWEHTVDNLLAENYGDAEFPKKGSPIEELLFQVITKRFVRSDVVHRTELEWDEEAKKVISQKLFINNKEVHLIDGIMSSPDADNYGTKCFISKGLKELEPKAVYGAGLTLEDAVKLYPIPSVPYSDMYDKLGGQLRAIQQHYPYIRWYLMPDGNFFLYHADKDRNIWSDPFVEERRVNSPITLPAIYDMAPAGTRTIRCPYIGFVGPMSTVLFESRYSIGTFTSFFYPVQTNAFLVILAKIEFATVQDFNTMELMCVDQERVELEKIGTFVPEPDPKAEPGPAEPPKTPLELSLTWYEYEYKVEGWELWKDIVNLLVVRADVWTADPDDPALPDRNRKIHDLYRWNKDNWKQWMKERPNSIENAPNGIGASSTDGGEDLMVPTLYDGDKIKMRYPYLPEYRDD